MTGVEVQVSMSTLSRVSSVSLKDGQKWSKSVSDTAKKEKARFVTVVAVVEN